MLFKESIISAIISIRSNAMRSFLTSLAIIIGTASVIAVIGIGSSANAALEAQIDDLGGRTLSVQPSQKRKSGATLGVNPLVYKDAKALADNNEHNWKISPIVNGYKQIKFKNSNIRARIGGYLPIHFEVRNYEIEFGRIFSEDDNFGRRRVVVLGSKVPSELKTSPTKILNQDISLNGVTYKVIGILIKKTVQQDGKILMLSYILQFLRQLKGFLAQTSLII